MQFLCTILVALWTCLVACFRLTFAIILPLQSHCAWFGSELDPFGNVGSALPFLQNDWHQVTAPHYLFVCISCREAGEAREPTHRRAGNQMFEGLQRRFDTWAKREGFVIAPYECLSVCTRPCGVAMRAPEKFTYVFGDLKPGVTDSQLIECASLFRRTPNGFMHRDDRPPALRGGILARVPPLEMP